MRLTIQQESPGGLCIRFPFPTCLLLNSVSALLLSRQFCRRGIPLTHRQLSRLFHIIRQYRHHHRDWVLLEVESAGGDHVEIRL